MRLYSLQELDSTGGTVLLHAQSDDGHLIHHPRPNPEDPNDPLRWPRWKKYVCFTSVCAFSFMTNYAIGGLAPAFYPLSLEFDKTMTQTSELLLWPILVLGVFNFLWVPLANYLGKRPVFVFTTLLLAMAYLWGAVAQTFRSLLWSNIVAAFAGSASEALAASIVNDVFFLHERANLMGWYMNAIAGGNTIGPFICGFVITGSTWRVHKWHSFGLAFLNFLTVLLFVPETRYERSFVNVDEASTRSEGSLSSQLANDDSPKPAPIATESTHTDPEKVISTPAIHPVTHNAPTPIAKKTFVQDLALFSGVPPNTSLPKLFLRPLPMIAYPAVILAFLGFALSLAWVVAINILNSFVLQAPPYNFRPDINGLINLPGLLGNLFGAWAGGRLVDRYSDRRSRRNRGVFEPESRLHLLLLPALLVPAGCLLWGYGVARALPWPALFLANGLVSVGLTATPTMTMTYVSDAYLPVNADALTLVVGLKNVVAFGFLYAIVPWVDRAGYVRAFGAQAGIYVALMVLGALPLAIWGKSVRQRTAGWRIIL